ncbi:hypothetical protein G7046_g5714 [Stylonectria norvegica]|nr:hypothetical protein G7046_g5714 [Stylonectria norvegica]
MARRMSLEDISPKQKIAETSTPPLDIENPPQMVFNDNSNNNNNRDNPNSPPQTHLAGRNHAPRFEEPKYRPRVISNAVALSSLQSQSAPVTCPACKTTDVTKTTIEAGNFTQSVIFFEASS